MTQTTHDKRSVLGAQAAGSAGSEFTLTSPPVTLVDSRPEAPAKAAVHGLNEEYAGNSPVITLPAGDANLPDDHGLGHALQSYTKPLTLAEGIDVHGQGKTGYEVE